ncbi:GNAT family N-acetyltransferase [Kaistella palustris]|uniref:GNAT family N-acetyltransferase n=1 Tax=Kaistella palustris TaxID=493376 RepID=UPI0004284EBB|nr:N-acetyltransferase [Kaistella palustris]
MEYIQISSTEDFRAAKIYRSYCDTFPADERRSGKQFKSLFNHQKVKIFSVLKELEDIGYLITWELTDFTFIEHFEIFAEYRSLKYGSAIIQDFCRKYAHVVLESEPATLDEIAERRIGFYERNGFKIIDKNYSQPAYEPDKNKLDLWLLASWQPENLPLIKEEIYDVVYAF